MMGILQKWKKLTSHLKPEPTAGWNAKPNFINMVLVDPRPDGCRFVGYEMKFKSEQHFLFSF